MGDKFLTQKFSKVCICQTKFEMQTFIFTDMVSQIYFLMSVLLAKFQRNYKEQMPNSAIIFKH